MKIYLLLPVYLLFGGIFNGYAQKQLILVSKQNSKKIKILNLKKEYEFTTTDTTYRSKIINFTDSSLFIQVNKDVLSTKKDSSTQITKDTINLLFSRLIALKKDWLKNKKCLEPFRQMIILDFIGIVAFPVRDINNENDLIAVKHWAIFEAYSLSLSFLAIFLGTRQTQYDLQSEWTIKTLQKN